MFGFKKSNDQLRLDIPIVQLLKVIGVGLIIYISFRLQDVIILLFLSFILMAATKPAVTRLQKLLRFPEPLSVFLIYVTVFIILGSIIYFISKPLSSQLQSFSSNAPELVNKLSDKFPFIGERIDGKSVGDLFTNQFSNLGGAFKNAISFTFSAFGALFQILTVIIISIYMLLEREKLLKFIILVFRLDQKNFYAIYDRVETQLGAWVRGQLFLGFIVGFFTYIGLVILKFEFALPLAVLSGIFEIIPIIGPIVSAVPIVIIGFSTSPVTGLLSLLLTIMVQQLENHLLVPVIMKRAVGLSPVVTLVAVLVGSKLFGLVGSIIAVPVAAIASALINIYFEKHGMIVEEDSVTLKG